MICKPSLVFAMVLLQHQPLESLFLLRTDIVNHTRWSRVTPTRLACA